MTSLFFNLLMILSVALALYIVLTLSIPNLSGLSLDGLTQWVNLSSGIRLLSVVIFGWLGAAGIVLGWVFCHLFDNEKSLYECVVIGIIFGLSALVSLRLWQIAFKVDQALSQMNLRLLISLVLVSSFISALARFAYIYSADSTASFLEIFTIGFIGDVLGSFIVLYCIKLTLSIKNWVR